MDGDPYKALAKALGYADGVFMLIPPYLGWYYGRMQTKSSLPIEKKQKILNRLKTARGHLDGIIKLVEDDTYCVQVIKQIAAVRGALDRVSRIELENHLEHCLVNQILDGQSAGAIAEVVEILGLRRNSA